MKKSLKLCLGLLLFVFVHFTLIACNDKEENQILSFWAYQPADQANQNAYKALLQKFTEETGIAVKPNFVAKDTYKKSFTSALGSSKKPDVAYLDQPLIADYASDNTIADLTSLYNDNEIIKVDRFFQGAYNTTLYKNVCYGVPLNITTSVLFYNEDLLPKNNGEVILPQSWNDWLSYEVAGDKALFEGIGNEGYASWYFQVFLEGAGGKLVNSSNTAITFNDENGQEAANFIKQLYAKSPQNVRDTTDAFGNGKVLFKLGSSSDIDKFITAFPKLNFGVMKVPAKNAMDLSQSNIGGENLVILNSSTKKAEAQKLIEFLLREDNMKEIASYTGNFAAIKAFSQTTDIHKKVVMEQLETANARPALPKWLEVNDKFLSVALESILSPTNPGNIKEKLDLAASQADELLFKKNS